MTDIIINDTGVDHLYPDGVPIAEVSATISDITKKVARITALVAQTDPFFSSITSAQKTLVELHGEGIRIFNDFLEQGAGDILPVFQSMQRWMGHFTDENGDPVIMYEYNTDDNPDKIIIRWQIMDTRLADFKYNYTSQVNGNIITDLNNVRHVQKYLSDALEDYVLMEFYKAIGHNAKYQDYNRAYNGNRRYVAYWAKNDRSLQTARNNE